MAVDRICATCGRRFVGRANRPNAVCSKPCKRGPFRATLSERFWAKVQKTEGCWLWQGAVNPDGYGAIWDAETRRLERAHRVAWKLAHGEYPNMHVLHHCDTPGCMRPDHLFLGTHLDNMRDRDAKGRTNTSGLIPGAVHKVRSGYGTQGPDQG